MKVVLFAEFLVDELKVMDDLLEAEKRVFFISAKEELNFRVTPFLLFLKFLELKTRNLPNP